MSFSISGVQVKVCLQLLSDKTLRVAVLPCGESVKEVFSTLDLRSGDWPEPDIVTDGADGNTRFTVGDFTVDITSGPLTVTAQRRGAARCRR